METAPVRRAKKARVWRARQVLAAMDKDSRFVANVHADEKCFFKGFPRIVYRKAGEPAEYRHRVSKRFPLKIMFLAVVSDQPGHAKIKLVACQEATEAKRASKNRPKGARVWVDTPITGEYYAKLMKTRVFPAIKAALPTRRTWYQHDNAPAHLTRAVADVFEAEGKCKRHGVELHPHTQTPNSPETNVLNHSVLNWLQAQVDKRMPGTREEVVKAVRVAWNRMPEEVVINSFASMRKVHQKIIDCGGGNKFEA